MSGFVPRVASKSKKQIEEEAKKLLKKHYPELLCKPGKFDVLDFWEMLQDEYDLIPGVDTLSDGVEGMTWPDGRVFVSEETYRGVINHNGRARFTMCHEAYHGIFHRMQIQNVLIDTGELALYRRTDLPPYCDPEWQANTFAASLLMPWETVAMVLAEAKDKSLEDMMYYFKVSSSAAKIRIKQFKLQKSKRRI